MEREGGGRRREGGRSGGFPRRFVFLHPVPVPEEEGGGGRARRGGRKKKKKKEERRGSGDLVSLVRRLRALASFSCEEGGRGGSRREKKRGRRDERSHNPAAVCSPLKKEKKGNEGEGKRRKGEKKKREGETAPIAVRTSLSLGSQCSL